MPSDWESLRSSCVKSRINHCGCKNSRYARFHEALPLALPPSFWPRFSPLSPRPAAAQTTSAVYAQQEGYVDAHGVLIYYVEFGNGSPLVVLHGGPGANHAYFLPWLLPLARTHRLIFIDERGSGRPSAFRTRASTPSRPMATTLKPCAWRSTWARSTCSATVAAACWPQAYALKYQQNLSHLILNSTFASTREMNAVLAREKAAMPPAKLARLNELEAGRPLRQGRAVGARPLLRPSTKPSPGAGATFRSSTARAPTPTTTRRKATPPPTGSFTARCGARTASSSSTAI